MTSAPDTRQQKTAYTVTDANGNLYDLNGHIYFNGRIARQIANEIDGMWYDAPRTGLKTVVVSR